MSAIIFAWIFIIPMLLVGSFCIGVRLFEIMCDIYESKTGRTIEEALGIWEDE